ncbi:MAG: RsmE family RNA methyltransferase [Chitinispirillaceae bacterium]|nr:RsmE family RNA methyltransferase [Chitinispirillaceae bacterium]
MESWRVEKSYWTTPLLNTKEIKKHLIIGLEQSGFDTIIPEVEIRRRFKPFAEDELPLIIKDKMALVAHPYNASPCPVNIDKPVVLMIGPEGGFIHYEIELLKKIGFIPVTIGKRLLKVETAVSVFVGRLLTYL